MVKVTVLPPGEAVGARDLQRWGNRRALGRSGLGRTVVFVCRSCGKYAEEAKRSRLCSKCRKKAKKLRRFRGMVFCR